MFNSKKVTQADNISLEGLSEGSRLIPQVLGRRGSQLVVSASHVRKMYHQPSGLELFALDDLFLKKNVVIGFGTPNTFIAYPDKDNNWSKFSGFMFFRRKSGIIPTKGRVQSGVLFEILSLDEKALEKLRDAAQQHAGKRTISCAWSCAQVLHSAGFTSGGEPLTDVVRPSMFAARLWQKGLEYDGKPVTVRIIDTGRAPGEHFLNVWKTETRSLPRLVSKILHKKKTGDSVIFEPKEVKPAISPAGKDCNITVFSPGYLGSHFGFIFGEQPIYSLELKDKRLQEMKTLKAYPGQLDKVTKLKRYVLFSKPVVSSMRKSLSAREHSAVVPAETLLRMLRTSSVSRDDAFVYNWVATSDEILVKTLENKTERDNKFINWILAKHVLMANYADDVKAAGEMWCYTDDNGQVVLAMSANSGTYKPSNHTLDVVAEIAQEILNVKVVKIYNN